MSLVIHRHADTNELVTHVATQLLEQLSALQQNGRVAELCLTGGRIALRIYQHLATIIGDYDLDAKRLELWWGDERFLPTDHPDRNAGPALSALAATFALDPTRTHPMPAADGIADAAASAMTYAKELGATTFDICLLGLGPDGHVASLFPDHPSFTESGTQAVIGVSEAPKPPPDRISLTIPTINRSAQVWFLVSGSEKAAAVALAVNGDQSVPAGVARGRIATHFYLDREAAAELPDFNCSL